MYDYRASVLRIVDGDTVYLQVDLGLDVHINIKTRLSGIDAPELSTPDGQAARAFLASLIPPDSLVRAQTVKDHQEKYGRYLVTLWPWDMSVDQPSINEHMVTTGHAVPYDGGKRGTA